MKRFEGKISFIFMIYFMIGFVFAFGFAAYYKWPAFGYLSPGFFMVMFTWPFQAIGFINDLLYYGLSGKPI